MSASLGLGPTRWHMQNMQTSEFLHLLGHSSGFAGSWDVFRGRWHNTAISGILLWRCVLSRAGWGDVSVLFSIILFNFKYLSGRPSWLRNFAIAHFIEFLWRLLLDVTSSPGRSLSSSTNESGSSRFGCHHPVILLQHLQESKWKSLPKMSLPKKSLPKKMSFCS